MWQYVDRLGEIELLKSKAETPRPKGLARFAPEG